MNQYDKYKECYGKCTHCKHRKMCELGGHCYTASKGIPQLNHQMLEFTAAMENTLAVTPGVSVEQSEEKIYSIIDLCELIQFIFSLDWKSFDCINLKLTDSSKKMAVIARDRNVTRQAIHKMFKKCWLKHPDLEAILYNMPNTMHEYKNVTKFKELMDKNSLTNTMLASIAGVGVGQIDYLRRKGIEVGNRAAIKYATIFKCKPEDLLGFVKQNDLPLDLDKALKESIIEGK